VARIVSFVVLIVIMLVVAVIFFQVMADFILPLFLALLLVIIFGPVYRWFCKECRGHNRLAAGLTTLLILVLILAPTFFLITQAIYEVDNIYRALSAEVKKENAATGNVAVKNEDAPADSVTFYHWIAKRTADLSNEVLKTDLTPQKVELAIQENIDLYIGPLARSTGGFLLSTLTGLFIMLIACYYFFVDGAGMMNSLVKITPLEGKYKDELLDRFVNVTRAVVLSQAVSCVAQGLLAGPAYYFAGAGAVFLLMVLTMLGAMIPFVGAAIIWGPVALWLFIAERTGAGVFIVLWGLLVITAADNIIKPWILHGRSKLHPLLALLSIIGGIKAMGPIGIIVGPMAVVFLQTLLNMINTELNVMSGKTPKEVIVAAK
jgi:predicted PurR-regulated permease PerM